MDSLKSQVKQLEYEFKTARFTIDEHCSHVNAKIYIHAETMITKINEERLALINKVDECQAKLFLDLDTRIDKPNVELALKEAQDFIKSEPTEIELIQQQLVNVRQEEQDLRGKIFDYELIDFEPIEKSI